MLKARALDQLDYSSQVLDGIRSFIQQAKAPGTAAARAKAAATGAASGTKGDGPGHGAAATSAGGSAGAGAGGVLAVSGGDAKGLQAKLMALIDTLAANDSKVRLWLAFATNCCPC